MSAELALRLIGATDWLAFTLLMIFTIGLFFGSKSLLLTVLGFGIIGNFLVVAIRSYADIWLAVEVTFAMFAIGYNDHFGWKGFIVYIQRRTTNQAQPEKFRIIK